MERDPFRRGGRNTKSQLPCSLFPSILLSPSLTTHLTPTPKMEKEGLCLSLSCLSMLQYGVTRWDVMRVGLRKTVGMLKSKGQGCGVGERRNFAAGELWDLYCCYCMYRDLSKQILEDQKQIQKGCAVVVTWEKERLDPVQVGRGRKRNRNTHCSGHSMAEGISAVLQEQHWP